MKNVILWVCLGFVVLNIFLFSDELRITGKVVGITCYSDEDCGFLFEPMNPCIVPRCLYPGTTKSYCDRVPINECLPEDNCCPDGCDFNNDPDCSVPFCGDGIINSNEICDGSSLGDKTCIDFGYSGGTLSCKEDCSDFNFDNCISFVNSYLPICGNSVIEDGEVCDSSNIPSGFNCESFGYSGGDLGCKEDCIDFNFDNCISSEGGLGDGGNEGGDNGYSEEGGVVGETGQTIIVGQSCNEGINSGMCSNIKPYYCNNGVLIENCGACGCNSGENCILNQCLNSNDINEINDECELLDEADCKINEKCLPNYKQMFARFFRIYNGCEMKTCVYLSKKECEEHTLGCKMIYDEFCIGQGWCFFKYYKGCEQA